MTELRADLSVAFGGTRELRAELLRTSMSGGASELREEFPRSISMILGAASSSTFSSLISFSSSSLIVFRDLLSSCTLSEDVGLESCISTSCICGLA